MDNPVTITVEKQVLKDLLVMTRRMVGPSAKYVSNNEQFLKGVISQQEDRANEMNNILTSIIYPE